MLLKGLKMRNKPYMLDIKLYLAINIIALVVSAFSFYIFINTDFMLLSLVILIVNIFALFYQIYLFLKIKNIREKILHTMQEIVYLERKLNEQK